MKARAVKIVLPQGYVECPVEEATHLTMNLPGPTGRLTLPVITKGRREGTNSWSWNGSLEFPTLRPSVLTRGHNFTCHSFINDGKIQFLSDCSHDMANTTVDLLDVEALDERRVEYGDSDGPAHK